MESKKRAVIISLLFLIFLLATPNIAAQDDEGNGEDTSGDTCVICSIIILIFFIVFMAYKNSKRRNQDKGGYNPSAYSGQPYQPGYRHPQRRAPPSQPAPVQQTDVKCDLCNSKNLRFFEKGYVKCNDCRHVFHMSEGYSRRRGR
jgi:hypothetical protein